MWAIRLGRQAVAFTQRQEGDPESHVYAITCCLHSFEANRECQPGMIVRSNFDDVMVGVQLCSMLLLLVLLMQETRTPSTMTYSLLLI